MRGLTLALAAAGSLSLATAATADVFVFNLDMSGAAESPSNASPGTGTGTVTIDNVAHTMAYDFTFADLLGTTTASHVHGPTATPFSGTAGIATELPSFTGFPLGVQSGSYSHVFDTTALATWNPAFVTANGGTALGAEAAFIHASIEGRTYLNIHTTQVPSGEIRSFLAYVPEPATWALMIAGFVMSGAVLRARRRVEVKISA